MGYGQQCGMMIIDAFKEEIQNDLLIFRIEVTSRFVSEDKFRLGE